MTPFQRMMGRLDRTESGCWEYTARRDPDGYGMVGSGVSGRSVRTHRLAYTVLKGPVPDGMMVCHTCDNPPCCNPEHLFLGTAKDNIGDCWAKNRASDRSGSNNGASKLTTEQVSDIHARYKAKETMTSIAKIHGIGFQNVSLIVHGIHRVAEYTAFHGFPPPENKPKARLTPEQTAEIRVSTDANSVLAARYCVSSSQISRIKNGFSSGSKHISSRPNVP